MPEFYSISILPNQTVIDISIQEYGTPEGVIMLMRDNALTGITQQLTPGATLKIRTNPAVANKAQMKWFREKALKVSTPCGSLVAGSIYGPHGILEAGRVIELQARPSGGDSENYSITWYVNDVEAGYDLVLSHEVTADATIYYVVSDGISEATSENIPIILRVIPLSCEINIRYGNGNLTAQVDVNGNFTLPPTGIAGNTNLWMELTFNRNITAGEALDFLLTTINPVWGQWWTFDLYLDDFNIYNGNLGLVAEENSFSIYFPYGEWNKLNIFFGYVNNYDFALNGRIQWELQE